MSGRTLFDMLEDAPDASPFIRFNGCETTYGEFKDRVLRIAGGLQRHGIQRGDVVAIWLPNTPEWAAAAFACARIGATALSLNLRYGNKEIADFVARAQCKALFYTPEYRGRNFDEVLASIDAEHLKSLILTIPSSNDGRPLGAVSAVPLEVLAAGDPDVIAAGRPGDSCIILASSGTTSKPKLIVHSQERVARHSRDVAVTFSINKNDSRMLLGIPLCGAFGYTVAMAAIHAHCPVVLMENFSPLEAAELTVSDNITHMFGTNDMLDKMLTAAGEEWRPTELKLYGHANFTPGLPDLPSRALAHGVRMRGCFGMSETLALFATQPEGATLERSAQSGGIPIAPGAKVRIRNVDTQALLEAGEIGEIEVYHPDVMVGYLGDSAATEKAFTDDGFLRTGDLGFLNPDGGFTHLSRIGDVLRIGGYLVNPLEIEETLLQDTGLPTKNIPHSCQVVEVEAQGSARPVAFVIGGEGYEHDEAALIAACKGKLAVYKTPIRIIAVDQFPTTPSPNGEKVRKSELRDMAHRILQRTETA